jgi:hypothetical protein
VGAWRSVAETEEDTEEEQMKWSTWMGYVILACVFFSPLVGCGILAVALFRWGWKNRYVKDAPVTEIVQSQVEDGETALTNNESAIAYGGIAVMVTVLLAMVLYIAIVPVWEQLYPLMTALDPTNHHATMNARINTAYDLFLILPVIMIGISVIFFGMRSIRRQAYSREYEEEFR